MNELLDCGHPASEHSEITTGYGRDENGKTFCYACCAEGDKQYMREHGKITLYLVNRNGKYFVTNWPSSLEFKVTGFSKGFHNIARTRYDVWFTFEGQNWHGVQYGDMTQICHCKRVK